jgi:hypothetical protein
MICVLWMGWLKMRVRLLMFVDRVDYFRAGAVGESGDRGPCRRCVCGAITISG